jgi:hypothetical protein
LDFKVHAGVAKEVFDVPRATGGRYHDVPSASMEAFNSLLHFRIESHVIDEVEQGAFIRVEATEDARQRFKMRDLPGDIMVPRIVIRRQRPSIAHEIVEIPLRDRAIEIGNQYAASRRAGCIVACAHRSERSVGSAPPTANGK